MENAMMKLKSVLLFAFVLSLLFFSINTSYAVSDYSSHWANKEITGWLAKGLLKGNTDGSIKPDNPITRAEFAALLNRIFGFTEKGNTSFSDVKPGDWYAGDIACAVKAGVLQGYGNGTIKPEAYLTRQEASVALARIFALEASNKQSFEAFKDHQNIEVWAAEACSAMKEGGYMKGRPDGTLGPRANITRAEAVKLLDNLMGEYRDASGEYTGDGDRNLIDCASNSIFKGITARGTLYIAPKVSNSKTQFENFNSKKIVAFRGNIEFNRSQIETLRLKGTTAVTLLKGSRIKKLIIEEGAKGSVINYDDTSRIDLVEGGNNGTIKKGDSILQELPGSSGTVPAKATSITAFAMAPDEIIVAWSGISGAAGYELEIDGAAKDAGSSTSYTHSGLNPNQKYNYRVRGKNSTGAGEWSSKVECVTLAEMPSDPSWGSAAKNSLALGWEPGGNPEDTEFRAVLTNPDNGQRVADSGWQASLTAWTFTGLSSSTTYRGWVQARNASGEETQWLDCGTSATASDTTGVTTRAGEEISLLVAAADVSDFSGNTYVVNYDPGMVELIDIYGDTPEADKLMGLIAGTKINVTLLDEESGVVKFKFEQAVAEGSTWTGVMTRVKFRAIKGGSNNITTAVER